MNKNIRLKDGFEFDFGTMMGAGRIQQQDFEALQPQLNKATEALQRIREQGVAKNHLSKDGTPEPVYFTRLPYVEPGNPNTPESIRKLMDFSEHLRNAVDAVLFLGAGGSYLGNKVLYDLFCGDGWNILSPAQRSYRPAILFGGNNLDPLQSRQPVDQVWSLARNTMTKGDKFRLMLVPISKSGTTLETLTAFSYFYEEFSHETYLDLDVAVVTDLIPGAKAPLLALAEEKNWCKFDVKNGGGGRFSVLHDVGLVMAAAIGVDIKEFLGGAQVMDRACQSADWQQNPALANAALKYLAAEKYGCDLEVFMGYGLCFKSLSEWYVQLLAESLGKRNNREGNTVFYGRTPTAAVGITDMHAQTQQHQDGKRNKVVQFLQVDDLHQDVVLGNPFGHIPQMAKYEGLSLNMALQVALLANREALDKDNRFTALYRLPHLTAYYIGELFYFLMLSIAYEGELADVDAYDQPGVEAYKKIIKRELGK
ncbi:MAG: glucose-6-phosphate isomerase [Phascolarctobacterium sp.]|nr:glucose-6-phosphate isomerase [Candidatus Phascolarctobacterium equi]